MDQVVMLTDDEVVAIAARSSVPWPGGAPTVQVDEESLKSAAFRGDRSLFARGLLDDEGALDGGVAYITGPILTGTNRVLVFLGDQNFALASWDHSSVHYPNDAAAWTLELISPRGVHRITSAPIAEHRDFLTELLKGISESESVEAGDASSEIRWLCIVGVGPEQARMVAARPGEVLDGAVVAGNDGIKVDGDLVPSDAVTAVARIFAMVAPEQDGV